MDDHHHHHDAMGGGPHDPHDIELDMEGPDHMHGEDEIDEVRGSNPGALSPGQNISCCWFLVTTVRRSWG